MAPGKDIQQVRAPWGRSHRVLLPSGVAIAPHLSKMTFKHMEQETVRGQSMSLFSQFILLNLSCVSKTATKTNGFCSLAGPGFPQLYLLLTLCPSLKGPFLWPPNPKLQGSNLAYPSGPAQCHLSLCINSSLSETVRHVGITQLRVVT